MVDGEADRVRKRRAPEVALPRQRFVPGGEVPHPRKAGTLPDVAAEAALRVGADFFDAGFYWEAHEVWEGLWVELGRKGPAALLVQALIKLAAAGVKELQGQPEGVLRHLDGASRLLDGLTGWPDIAESGERQGDTIGIDTENVDHRCGVDLRHLMEDVPVHVGPAPAVLVCLVPADLAELGAGLEECSRVGTHALQRTDAEIVVLGRGPELAPHDPVASGVLGMPTENRRR